MVQLMLLYVQVTTMQVQSAQGFEPGTLQGYQHSTTELLRLPREESKFCPT